MTDRDRAGASSEHQGDDGDGLDPNAPIKMDSVLGSRAPDDDVLFAEENPPKG